LLPFVFRLRLALKLVFRFAVLKRLVLRFIFYRFRHLSSTKKYGTVPARLRMQVIRSHGSDPVDFELWCLAVSAINGCGVCVDSHEKALREKGVGEETILAAVRTAPVIHALAAVMDAVTV